HSIRRSRGDLRITTSTAVEDDLAAAAKRALAEPGSVGVIGPDVAIPAIQRILDDHGLDHGVLGEAAEQPDEEAFSRRLDLVPASIAKGLEFDHVVLLEPADIVAAEPDHRTGLRRLYVCLTRAVTSLQVVHSRPLP